MLERAEDFTTHRDEAIRIVGSKNKNLFLLGCRKRIDSYSETSDFPRTAASFVKSFWIGVITIRNICIEIADTVDIVGVRCDSSVIDQISIREVTRLKAGEDLFRSLAKVSNTKVIN